MRAPLPQPHPERDAVPAVAVAPLQPVAGAAPVAGRVRLSWVGAPRPLTRRRRVALTLLSFLLPLGLWAAVSYLPFLWHPLVEVTNPGDVAWMEPGMRVPRAAFSDEVAAAQGAGMAVPEGRPANPVYLPAPHEVAVAFWTSLTAPPPQRDTIWLPASLWHSIQIIFWGFTLSSLVGVPLGILCGAQPTIARLTEPVIEFVRYLPAPAFGALMVAILGIYDGPKIAIIVIGTFFQQVLVIANTTRRVDPLLIEAALTMGSRNLRLIRRVIVPAVLPQIYRDQRILLGWAWTYLIVAELIGTSSGITFFITQQARYQHFDNVYAAILVIGLVGIATDIVLALLGRRLFPYARAEA
ncbi:ABC transporter permease [Methylorubrum extorquens]|uniref:ABC transporter, permease n=1 Tax=Methylorubrum extorquens (strain ATCC 14718 / DSM 1338 / JCM 2805 / NCIMB 9133 / AM1) TaxID=272630 RepID=C5B1F3_METEA|nr:ABC transporter permease [Methylorubrum extorquens]ACS41754.1 ABC transporter, permease [Methylorubrum extorquens AM1]MCP1545219.1 NitT/TauT family transport system permease protein [Methylorubrum extorquens]MCP1587434.1 NitT/TauT family transport system permease protein [Methylorubrum extorquens]